MTIDFDIPCAVCGYNLRGLSLDARCPECGDDVGRSLRARRRGGARCPLSRCDAGWVRSLESGAAYLCVAALLAQLPALGWSDPGPWFHLAIVPHALACWGAWLLGSRDPDTLPDQARENRGAEVLRRCLRAASVVAFLAPLWGWFASEARGGGRPPINHWPQRFLRDSLLLQVSAWTTLAATALVHLRILHLARRLPGRRALAVQAGALAVLAPLGVAGWVLLREWRLRFRVRFDEPWFMSAMPMTGAGTPDATRLVAGWLADVHRVLQPGFFGSFFGSWEGWLALLNAAVPLWAAAVAAVLTRALRRARRGAATGRRSPASSRP